MNLLALGGVEMGEMGLKGKKNKVFAMIASLAAWIEVCHIWAALASA